MQLDANGNSSITIADIDNGSNDASGIASLVLSNENFDCTNVGANTVTLTATDNNGNSATCDATITVEDSVAPSANCQNATVQLDDSGNGIISSADIDNGSNDACGIQSLSLDKSAFDITEVGSQTVTLTVTDNNGNSSTCTASVEVQDNTGPAAFCQHPTIVLDADGNANISAMDIDDGSNDASGIALLSLSIENFDCSHTGSNTVILTVTDNNGNSSNCTAEVTVGDATAPAAICQNTTVLLDANGYGSITAADINNGSNDACGIQPVGIDNTAFDMNDVGSQTVTLFVIDNNGNSSTCTALVDVLDNTVPTAICQNTTIQLDADGNASISAIDINDGSNDASGIASLSLSIENFDCSHIGTNTTTLTVTDNNGNSSICNLSLIHISEPTRPY